MLRSLSSTRRILSLARNRSFSSTFKSKEVMKGLLQIDDTVRAALENNRPVVALESTIVAHGMPYPENLDLCKKITSILRSKGVEPATIAVKDGVCRVGLSLQELEDLAVAKNHNRAQKISTRELSLILAKHANDDTSSSGHQWGATTVASTMTLAHAAGISTFVTGGIGGVHRHGEVSMDVSADLTELSRTPVVVVSAGIKSILDIPRTLEVLETNGVPVVAYQTDEFPAFFSPHSGAAAPDRMDDAATIASAYWAARDLNLPHGMLVAVPNQDPVGANVEDAIQEALKETEEQGIHGQAVTPFILKRVGEKTGGDSLRSNMALVEQNAKVGADIAIAICKQRGEQQSITIPTASIPSSRVVVMGGIVMDIVAKPEAGSKLIPKTSNPATCSESDGGVGRNVAEVLGRLGSKPLLYSAVGHDSRGTGLLNRLSKEYNVSVSEETVNVVDGESTATYVAVLDGSGDLFVACSDMGVLEKIKPPPVEVLEQADILVIDANGPLNVLQETALLARKAGAKVFFEPTSVPKALEVGRDGLLMSCLTYASPNLDELSEMADGWTCSEGDAAFLAHDENFETIRPLAKRVLERMSPEGAHLLITMGAKGVLLASKWADDGDPIFQHFPAPEGVEVLNATGAGDTFCGAFIHGVLQGKPLSQAVSAGMKAAKISLECEERAISPRVSDLE